MELNNYSAAITAVESSVCQAPNGYHLSIVGGYLVDTSNSSNTITLKFYSSAGTLKSSTNFILAANGRIDLNSKIFLNQLETLKVVGTGTATIVVFGAETVKSSDNVPDDWSWLGAWSSATAYVPNNLVSHNGSAWLCEIGNTNSEPPSANWTVFASKGELAGLTDIVQDLTPQLGGNLDLNGHVITGLVLGTNVQAFDADTAKLDVVQTWVAQQTFKETADTVHAITDGVAFEIDPANGNIQTVILGAARTPLATNFAAGQCVLLGIDDGIAYAITWTGIGVTWVTPGGTAEPPVLAETGYTWIMLWKEGSTIYGTEVGAV